MNRRGSEACGYEPGPGEDGYRAPRKRHRQRRKSEEGQQELAG